MCTSNSWPDATHLVDQALSRRRTDVALDPQAVKYALMHVVNARKHALQLLRSHYLSRNLLFLQSGNLDITSRRVKS